MRVCANPVREIMVRWFTLPDCADFLPFPTVFTSDVWWPHNFDYGQSEDVGWVEFPKRIWDAGLPPVPELPYAAGDPSWWVDGIPANMLPP